MTGIYGRRIDRHALGETETTIGSGIFNGTALRRFDEIIVTATILDAWTFYSAGYTNVICPVAYALQIADLASVKRVLLASASIDCEAFTNCEIFQIRFPAGQSAHQYQLAQRGAGISDPLGHIIRAAGWQSGVSFQLANSANSDGKQDAYPTTTSVIEQPHARQETAEVAEPKDCDAPASQHTLASPVPLKLDDLQVTMTAADITITTEWRRYRIRGLERNTMPGVMKINLLIYNEHTERFARLYQPASSQPSRSDQVLVVDTRHCLPASVQLRSKASDASR